MVNITNISDGSRNWGPAMRSNLNNLNTGVEAVRTLAQGVKDDLAARFGSVSSNRSGVDLNVLVEQGLYSGAQLVNGPAALGTNFAYIAVQRHFASDWNLQTVTEYAEITGTPAAQRRTWTRQMQNSTWTAWTLVTTADGAVDATARSTASSKYTKPAGGIPDSDLASKFVKTINGTAPDFSGNIVVSGGGTAPVTSVAGKTGDVTLAKSDVGLSNVDNTSDANKPISILQGAAINAKYTKPASGIPAADVAANVAAITAATNALKNYPMVTEGHSFMVGSGVSSPNKWAEQFATMFGMTYPTSNGSATAGDLMRAVGGSSAEEISQRAFGAGGLQYKWRLGDRYMLLSENLINTSRRTGQDAAARTGALHSVRGLVALACSDRAYPATDTTFFTYSAGWTTSSVSTSMSGTVYNLGTSASSAGNVTFSMPSPGKAWVLVLSRNASLQGNFVRVYNMSKNTLQLATLDNTNTAAADTPGTYITIPIEVRAEPGDTIRVDAPGAQRLGNFSFDGLLVAGRTPAPVLLMKEPYLNDYSLSTTYPKGSDAVFDYFNSIHDDVAKEFGNVIVANPNTAGYWDKTTMIQSDGVHPNVAGSTALAQTMRDAVLAQLPTVMARSALGLT